MTGTSVGTAALVVLVLVLVAAGAEAAAGVGEEGRPVGLLADEDDVVGALPALREPDGRRLAGLQVPEDVARRGLPHLGRVRDAVAALRRHVERVLVELRRREAARLLD